MIEQVPDTAQRLHSVVFEPFEPAPLMMQSTKDVCWLDALDSAGMLKVAGCSTRIVIDDPAGFSQPVRRSSAFWNV